MLIDLGYTRYVIQIKRHNFASKSFVFRPLGANVNEACETELNGQDVTR